MRKRSNIFFFLFLLLSGYGCQIGRYCTAFQQFNNSHTYEKGLTKRVLALRSNAGPSITDKKLFQLKKQLNSKDSNPLFLFSTGFSFLFGFDKNNSANKARTNYFSPLLFSSGKRGPPALV